MGDGVSIDFGDLAPYLEQKILTLFGRDPDTKQWNERFKRRLKLAIEQARSIQCIGMDRPIPIEALYQPLRLRRALTDWEGPTNMPSQNVDDVLARQEDAVILAGPGKGKSTLLNWLFIRLLGSDNCSPVLFLLRTEDACSDLEAFVQHLSKGKKPKGIGNDTEIVLLVDGYDEISVEDRKRVSASLSEFKAHPGGRFYLTCRTFYDIYDLKVPRYQVLDLTEEDSINFVIAFSRYYDRPINAKALIEELKRRRLSEFAKHPLLLTLTCILKSGVRPDLPHNAVALLRRAFDTLTFRWDEQKGVRRQAVLPLDGDDRISCTMHIAYQMRTLQVRSDYIESLARQFMSLINVRGVDPRVLVLEIARWYGVLTQVGEDSWQFAHRCIHDYLAARYMVENGKFQPATVRVWNSRAAYAACLQYDATEAIVTALERARDMQAFSECLYNRARFQTRAVAAAVIRHFQKYSDFLVTRTGTLLTAQTDKNIFALSNNAFLMDLAAEGIESRPRPRDWSEREKTSAHDLVAAYAMATLHTRRKYLNNPNVLTDALNAFGTPDFTFQIGVQDPYSFRLRQAFAPNLQGMMR